MDGKSILLVEKSTFTFWKENVLFKWAIKKSKQTAIVLLESNLALQKLLKVI